MKRLENKCCDLITVSDAAASKRIVDDIEDHGLTSKVSAEPFQNQNKSQLFIPPLVAPPSIPAASLHPTPSPVQPSTIPPSSIAPQSMVSRSVTPPLVAPPMMASHSVVQPSVTQPFVAPPMLNQINYSSLNYPGRQQCFEPQPRLNLDSFNGDILKYHPFKRKFIRCIENSHADYEIRTSFLEEVCVGAASEVISGLSCFDDRQYAYKRAWKRLDQRFGDRQKLMTRVKGYLLEGPPIKEYNTNGLLDLCDLMYKCETSFAAWGKLELLNSDEVIQGLFQRLPCRIKTQFVSVSRKGSDECLFQS